jgi:hypothetical protein
MTSMRGWLVLAVFAVVGGSAAHADAPSKKLAKKAAETWIRSLGSNPLEAGEHGMAPPVSTDPFLFDHDSENCKKKKKKAKDILECLADETTSEIRDWAPERLRIHTDAKFTTWQPDRKRDVIEKHRKELAKLKDHVFVHFDMAGKDGTWEMLVAVKLDKEANVVVDAYLANFLPTLDKHVDENAAIAIATSWVRAMADSDETRKSNAHRTGYPFWELGLPIATKPECKREEKATSSKDMWNVSSCVAGSENLELLDHLPRSAWEVVENPAHVKTHADQDTDNFAVALDRLDRLAYDHVFLYNHVTEGDLHFEILLALRDEDGNPVVDAVVANLY